MQEYEFSGKAMGTDYSISIVSYSDELTHRISKESIKKIQEYEKRFSRFLPESELSRLNSQKNMVVSREFMDVIQKAFSLFKITKGIFNPLVQIERMGYNRDFSKRDSFTSIERAETYDIDFETVSIDEQTGRVILQEGQKLDFGGFLKGYLAEMLCKEIMEQSPLVTGAIVNIGGDIHTQGTDAHGETFIFDIFNPVTKEEVSIGLHNQSLATSGTYKRAWTLSNVPMHHILDSSGTHNPNTDIVSSSVVSTDGGKAEAYAKVFLSLGEKAVEVVPDKDIVFVLIKQDGSLITNFK